MFLIIFLRRINILIQNSYNMPIKWILKNHYKDIIFCLLNIIYFNIYKLIILNILYIIINKPKKIFKITKRFIRFIIPSILIFIFINNYMIDFVFCLFVDFFIFILLLINRFIERFIYRYYYINCKRKLNNFKGIIIGVCGSYGKTTLKNYLYHFLKLKYNVFKTPKSYNTPMGISKVIKDIFIYDILIIEMGISKKGDSKELIDLINPDIVILNNIGIQHQKNFKNDLELRNEKLYFLKGKVNFCGFDYDDTISYDIKNYKIIDNKIYKQDLYLFDNIYKSYITHNLLGCIEVLLYLGIDIKLIRENLYNLPIIENRFNYIKYKDFTLVDNSFNSNYLALFEEIDNLKYKKKAIFTNGFLDVDERYNYLLFNKIYENFDLILSNKSLFKSDKTRRYKNYKIIKKLKNYDLIFIENDLNDYYRGII